MIGISTHPRGPVHVEYPQRSEHSRITRGEATAPVAMVTGASSGIGASIASKLSHLGYPVVLTGRDPTTLASMEARLPGPAISVSGDVTSSTDIEATFRVAEETFGSIGVLVINAGTGFASPLIETSDDEWYAALDVNLTAPFRWIRRALPGMTGAGWGRVIVVASIVAKRGEMGVAAYTASKHGVLGLVRSASVEFAEKGVTVNAVCPGYTDTPMTDQVIMDIANRRKWTVEQARSSLTKRQPIKRLIAPDEVANLIMVCVDNPAINGQGINVDGGAVQS